MSRIAVVGPGRVGLSFARALIASGEQVTVVGRRHRQLPDGLGEVRVGLGEAVAGASTVLIAVPDESIAAVAKRLAGVGRVDARTTVLHLSGLLPSGVLGPLRKIGATIGSLHPLQSFADPEGNPELLRGAPAVIEGDRAALLEARRIAKLLEMDPVVVIDAVSKAKYHAAAVMASNWIVVLAQMAGELVEETGIDAGSALFQPIMAATVARLAATEPIDALTGPIRRGDADTVAAHLAALDGDALAVYQAMGRKALAMARAAGLDEERAGRVEEVLGGAPGRGGV